MTKYCMTWKRGLKDMRDVGVDLLAAGVSDAAGWFMLNMAGLSEENKDRIVMNFTDDDWDIAKIGGALDQEFSRGPSKGKSRESSQQAPPT